MRRLVRFECGKFLEVDQVALLKGARSLMKTIGEIEELKFDDPYEIKKTLTPILNEIILNGLERPFKDREDLIGGLFFHQFMEGGMPDYLTKKGFEDAFIKFSRIAVSQPLDYPEIEIHGGLKYAYFDFEEE